MCLVYVIQFNSHSHGQCLGFSLCVWSQSAELVSAAQLNYETLYVNAASRCESWTICLKYVCMHPHRHTWTQRGLFSRCSRVKASAVLMRKWRECVCSFCVCIEKWSSYSHFALTLCLTTFEYGFLWIWMHFS